MASTPNNSTSTIDESYRFCAAQLDFSLDFTPPAFVVNAAIENLHTRIPRFGHTNDINQLIQGSNAQQKDYLTGLLAGSFAVFCLFVLWMCLLLIMKFMGPKMVGFLSAQRQVPTKPIKPPAVLRQERIRKKFPFQHNGVAGGNDDSTRSPGSGGAKKILKPVVGVAKAPITVVSKARQKKREIERRHQFSRMDSNGSMNENSNDDDDQNDARTEDAGNSAEAPEESAPSKDSDVLTDADRTIIREYEQEWKAYEREVYRGQDRIRRIRIGAGFCAIGITIAALLFTIMTQKEFTASLDMFGNGLDQVDQVIQAALATSAQFAEREAMARESTRKFYLEINEICPNEIQQLCTNVNDETATNADERGCDFSTLPYGEELAQLINVMDTTMINALEELGDFEQDLLELQDLLDKADTYYPKHGTWVFWTSAGCSLALGLVSLLLTGGMIYIELGRGEQSNGAERQLPKAFAFCRSWMLVPIMLFLVVSSWILAMTFIWMGIGTADLCYNSPDVPMLNMLEVVKDEFNSPIYFFLRYYISGCPAADSPRGLEIAAAVLQETVLPAIGEVTDAIQAQGEEALEATCGTVVAPYLAILAALGNQLCLLGMTMADLRSLFQCDLWYPIYRVTMHEAICSYATQGFTWAAATQIVIVLLSLVLLTLRVSFYELEEVAEKPASAEDDAEDNAEASKGCHAALFCSSGNRRQVAPKNSNVGEIKVDPKKLAKLEEDRAKKAKEAIEKAAAAKKKKEEEAAAKAKEADESSYRSVESGSIEEVSLKG